jgi:thiol-disulfide isomerase/thioredoxin
MRFTLTALVLAAAVGFAPADDAKKDDKATPEKQFQDLQKQYLEAMTQFQKDMQAAKSGDEQKKINDAFQPKHEKLAAQFLALGKANPKEKFAFDALAMATQDTTTSEAALKLLVDHFADDPKILQLVPMLSFQPNGQQVLAKLATSKNTEVRAGVKFLQLTGELERAEGDPTMKADAKKKVFADAPARLAALVKEYGEVTVMGDRGPVKLTEAAKDITYMLDNLVVGKTLADVDCPALADGKPAKISDYRGKVVVLDIWATWCGPCKAMIPHEREMVKKLKDKPFALISVSADDKQETLTKFLEKTEMPWTHWHAGAKGELLKKYQVKFFPTIYVLDAKGVIRFKNIRDKDLEAAVEELLKEMGKAE